MTQPTDRPGIDDLTSNQLDALYAERDAAQGDRDGWRERADTYRDAWHSAKDRVTKQRTRAEQAEAILNAVRDELHALNSEVRLNPIALAGRRDAVARIRAVLDQHGQTPA